MKGYITAREASEKLGVSKRRVLALITAGQLPAESIGGLYIIKESDLRLIKDRKPGRPRVVKKNN